MGTIQRAIKRGNVRRFDDSYNKGFKSAQANEVDADFDQLYDAWNFGTINVADGSVGTGAIADGAVTSNKLAPNSVNSNHIIDGAVAEVDISPLVTVRIPPTYGPPQANMVLAVNVPGTALTWLAAPPATLTLGQVTTPYIADAPNGVTDAKITSLSWAKITGAPTSIPPSGAAGGALTGSYPNPSIKPNGVTSVEIADGAVSTTELASGAVTDIKVSDVAWGKITGRPTSLPPSGAAGGALTGSYPNPGVSYGAITGIPASLPPSGVAGGALYGSYPNPGVDYNQLANKPAIPTTLPPSGAASGDLAGNYPFPQVMKATGDFAVGNDLNVTRNVNASGGNGSFNQVQMVGGRYWTGSAYGNAIAFLWNGSAVQMNVDGTSKGTINTTGSDQRLKLNIREDSPGLDAVLALRPITFEYDQDKVGIEGRQYGLIAQEAQPHIPLVVREDSSNDRYLSIDYHLLVPVLVRAIQELAQRTLK